MSDLADEICESYSAFLTHFESQTGSARVEFKKEEKVFISAYARLASLNSWRLDVLGKSESPEVLAFVLEAQNDGLSSLALAGIGAWRASLHCLRALLENMLMSIYFAKHSVELELWKGGTFKIGAGALFEYYEKYPGYSKLPVALKAIVVLRAEYATLSRSVHGQVPFRMTKDADTAVLVTKNKASFGAYMKRHREILRGLNLLLTFLYASDLRGTRNRPLRHLIGSQLTPAQRSTVKAALEITLPSGL